MPAESQQNNEEKSDNNAASSPDKKRVKLGGGIPPTSSSIKIGHNDVEKSSSSSFSPNSQEKSVPLWVAGSSPAKFVSLEDLIKMNDSIEKMAIVHQIAIDPKCTVEDLKSKDPLFEQVKTNMHKAYWDLLREDLAKGEASSNEHAFSLFKDLKKMITEHLEEANLMNALSAVDDALDLDHLREVIQRGVINFNEVLNTVLAILEKLCAPVRDELVAKLKAEMGTVELFMGIFNLVELMQLDMANFTLSKNRQLIGSYSAKIEFDEFMKVLKIDKSAADHTQHWLRRILLEFVGTIPSMLEELTRANVNELIGAFYLQLLATDPTTTSRPSPQQFPETLKLDEAQIEQLGRKLLQLELTVAAIFMAANLTGKAVCEGKPTFKTELKRDLLVILNDVDWRNYPEKLKNVALQCDKKCREAIEGEMQGGGGGGWTEEWSKLARQQLLGLANRDEQIRTIARTRIHGFIRQALRQSSAPLRIPPGLSVVQTELASLTSRFYAIAVHNWNAFGRFYGQILDEEFQQIRRAEEEK